MSRHQVQITTIADGTATVVERCRGEEILGVEVERGEWGDTLDIVVTETLSGVVLYDEDNLTGDKAKRNLVLACGTDGVDLEAVADDEGDPPGQDQVLLPVICYDSVTIAIAGGGNQKTGNVIIHTRS